VIESQEVFGAAMLLLRQHTETKSGHLAK